MASCLPVAVLPREKGRGGIPNLATSAATSCCKRCSLPVRAWWAQQLQQQWKCLGMACSFFFLSFLLFFLPPFFSFCLASEEPFILGLCGLQHDAVPHLPTVFPGATRLHGAQPRVITCCVFPKLGTKGEDFLFSLGCWSHLTLLRVQSEGDFKNNLNKVPSCTFSFNQEKVFHHCQNGKNIYFLHILKLSPTTKGGIRNNGFEKRFLPRAGNIFLPATNQSCAGGCQWNSKWNV